MVFVVRRDLAWSKQKLSVMTAHAALALFKKLYKGRNPALMQWVSGTHAHMHTSNSQRECGFACCTELLTAARGACNAPSTPAGSSLCISPTVLTRFSPRCSCMQQELAKGPKLVLRADNEQQLLAALEAARAAGIPYHSIAEASSSSDGGAAVGRSSGGGGDVAVPRKSRTILALGPLPAEDLPKVAAGLVLL